MRDIHRYDTVQLQCATLHWSPLFILFVRRHIYFSSHSLYTMMEPNERKEEQLLFYFVDFENSWLGFSYAPTAHMSRPVSYTHLRAHET